MVRLSLSLAALAAAAVALTGASRAADYGDDFAIRGPIDSIEPKDWTDFGNENDSFRFEFGLRYWYSFGAQNFSSGGGATTESDQAHILEGHLRIEDDFTNTFAKANVGYSVAISGTYAGPLVTAAVADGTIAYAGADLAWMAFGDNSAGAGILVGYQYWENSPDTGRNNFTTANSSADIPYSPVTGQTFLPGDSAADNVLVNAVRLGIQGKVDIGEMFDISGELVAVPYAKVGGTVGVDDPLFSNAVYGGPAQPPYSGVATGNIAWMRTSPTAIDGWGYGAMAEAWLGVHPTENITVRLGGRAWYLQGTADATFSAASIGNPVDSDLNGTYDTPPTFVEGNFISTNNPFSMFRYGVLGELTYRF